MTAPLPTETAEPSLTRALFDAARYYLGGRRGLLILAGLALIAGLALNWSWLVAAGIAPLLVSVLPCVAMCALGLCMNKMTGRSCSPEATSQSVGKRPGDDATPGSRAEATEFPTVRLTDDRETSVAAGTAITPQSQIIEKKEHPNA